jgi:hypothetical protein
MAKVENAREQVRELLELLEDAELQFALSRAPLGRVRAARRALNRGMHALIHARLEAETIAPRPAAEPLRWDA